MKSTAQYVFLRPVSWLAPHRDTLITRGPRRRGVGFLTGYILCVLCLFIGSVLVKGWYTTLIIFGIFHVGCTVVFLLLWLAHYRAK
jgi:hypothetical protein